MLGARKNNEGGISGKDDVIFEFEKLRAGVWVVVIFEFWVETVETILVSGFLLIEILFEDDDFGIIFSDKSTLELDETLELVLTFSIFSAGREDMQSAVIL